MSTRSGTTSQEPESPAGTAQALTKSMARATPSAEHIASPKGLGRLRTIALRFGMVWALLALIVFANVMYPGFAAPQNINNLFSQVAPTGIVAVGMTYVILVGGFDLSVAAILATATVLFADFSNRMPLAFAFLLALLVCVVGGLLNGFIVTIMKVNPFIATLSTSSLFLGAAYMYSDSTAILSTNPSYSDLGLNKFAGIWVSNWVMTGFLLVFGLVLARTVYGRSIYAVGGNKEAARLAGVPVNPVQISAYVVTAICAAVGGAILSSQAGVGQASLGGSITLDSIAVVIIGGTSLMGGEGAMWRTFVGISIWGTLSNLFNSLALSTAAQLSIQGAILLFAVSIDVLSRRSRP